MFCSQCGSENDDTAKFCIHCGSALSQTTHASIPSPVLGKGSSSAEEFYKAVIGDKNQAYYLRHFAQFDRNGKAGVTWNWPAFFITFYWFLYRKMWLNAIIYFFSPYLVMALLGIITVIIGDRSGMLISVGYISYLGAVFILLPMYANALYYKHCQSKISDARISSPVVERQLGVVSGRGGTSGAALFVVFLIPFVAIIGILAAIAIPAYQDYTVRARLSNAVTIGSRL